MELRKVREGERGGWLKGQKTKRISLMKAVGEGREAMSEKARIVKNGNLQ